MNQQLQPDHHPNADQLSAFVEHALPLHEQQQTLAHLAHCADCRNIVYLSQEPDGESLPETPHVSPIVAARRGWFSARTLAWPLVAAASLLFATVLLHNSSVKKGDHSTTSSTASSPMTPKSMPATPQTPQPFPPASPARSIPERPEVSKKKSVVVTEPSPVVPTQESRAETAHLIQEQSIKDLPINGRNLSKFTQIQPSSENAANKMSAGAALADPAPALQRQPIISLPSHLATVSTTTKERQILAIDTSGTLFLSDDVGQHWTAIRPHWTGRAIKVNFRTSMLRGRPANSTVARTNAVNTSADALKDMAVSKAAPQPASHTAPRFTGVVTDTSGAAIPNATVIVTNTKTLQMRSVKTDNSGRYNVERLEPGVYQISAQSPGFLQRQLNGISVAASEQALVNLKLDVGTTTETVQVNAEARMVAPLSSSFDAKITSENPTGSNSAVFELTTDNGSVWTSTDGRTWKPE